jgi:hypothetical protein
LSQIIIAAVYKKLFISSLILISVNSIILGQQKTSAAYNSLLYFRHDNDIFKFNNQTDKYYSFGIPLGYQKLLSEQAKLLKLSPFTSSSKSKYLVGTQLYLKGFTSLENSDSIIQSSRPFARVLALRSHITVVNTSRLLKIGIEIGVRGPASGAEKVQTKFHRFIDISTIPGWKNKLPNHLITNAYGTYSIPFRLHNLVELIPETLLALGNQNSCFQQGLIFRVGLFNDISNSRLYNTHLGEWDKDNKEIFVTAKIFYRAVAVDAEKVGLERLNKDNRLIGYEIKLHMQSKRFGLVLAYNQMSSDSNFTQQHSYGSVGMSIRI